MNLAKAGFIMARNYMQGKYTPINESKYMGNARNIVFRSSWERCTFVMCDNTPEIVKWSSETMVIPYISPIDGRQHRYFIDLTILVRNTDGTRSKFLVEVKPYSQTQKPRKTARKAEKTYLNEVGTYVVNQAKWAAARKWCLSNGYSFLIWTERELGLDQKFRKP